MPSKLSPVRLQQLDQQRWMKIELISHYEEGRVVKLEPMDQVLGDVQLKASEALDPVPIIDLSRSHIPTAQLDALRRLPNLHELIISGAPIKNADMKLVGAMRLWKTFTSTAQMFPMRDFRNWKT